jgi:hypothetical protein
MGRFQNQIIQLASEVTRLGTFASINQVVRDFGCTHSDAQSRLYGVPTRKDPYIIQQLSSREQQDQLTNRRVNLYRRHNGPTPVRMCNGRITPPLWNSLSYNQGRAAFHFLTQNGGV